MHISEFQDLISKKYEERDRERGVPRTFMWFIEEVGELSTALAGDDQDNKVEEIVLMALMVLLLIVMLMEMEHCY